MIKDVEATILEQWYDWCMENTKLKIDLIGTRVNFQLWNHFSNASFA